MNALALQLGLPTEGSVKHSITSQLKVLASLAFSAETTCTEVDNLVG